MIITSLNAITGTDRDVSGPGWKSRRLLLAGDGMGYTMTDTLVLDGAELELEYKHHLEACYCISGRGEVTNLATLVKRIRSNRSPCTLWIRMIGTD